MTQAGGIGRPAIGISEGTSMNSSSGMKRGLAATAISALAVTGLPLFAGSAHADSINDQVGAGNVELKTQDNGVASVQNDGVNTTVHLLAGGGSDVVQVRFEYVGAGAPVVIDTVSRVNGVFSTEWAPPVSTYGSTVLVRAVGLSSVGTPIVGAEDAQPTLVSANAPAIDIANAPGSALGIYPQPYGVESEEAPVCPAPVSTTAPPRASSPAPPRATAPSPWRIGRPAARRAPPSRPAPRAPAGSVPSRAR